MTDCEHGFVVRSAQGANRFLCRECNGRFLSYPKRIRRGIVPSEQCEQRIKDTLSDEYVYAKGVEMRAPLTYTFPVVKQATSPYTFQGNKDD